MIATSPNASLTWWTDRDEAFAEARRLRKPILIDVYQDDCGGCDKLDDVTFADESVASEIRERFIPLKVHLFKDRDFTRQQQIFWTPTILIADHSGKVRYSSINFVPPEELLDVLDIGEGMVAMRWQEYDRAIRHLEAVETRRPDGPMTAEAIYWRGMVEYFRDRKSAASSRRVWQKILDRFPDSIWAKRQP